MVSRAEIKARVIEKLFHVTEHQPIVESDDLRDDLGMSAPLIEGMATPYDKISLSYPGGLHVRQSDTRDNETVKDSIDVVFDRANGKKG